MLGSPLNMQLNTFFGDREAIIDHIAHRLVVNGDDNITWLQAKLLGRAARLDVDDNATGARDVLEIRLIFHAYPTNNKNVRPTPYGASQLYQENCILLSIVLRGNRSIAIMAAPCCSPELCYGDVSRRPPGGWRGTAHVRQLHRRRMGDGTRWQNATEP